MLSSFQFKLIFMLILIYTESKILNKKRFFTRQVELAARQSESAAQLFTGTGFVVVVVLTSGMLIKMAPGIVSETLKVQCHEIFIFQPLQTRGIQSVIKKRKAGGGGERIRQPQHERQFCRESDHATALYADF